MTREELHEAVMNTPGTKRRKLLSMRYGFYDGKRYSREEVAEEFGITVERVIQVEREFVRKVIEPLMDRKLLDELRKRHDESNG